MPASQAPRHAFAKALKPLLPRKWQIIPYSRNVDTLSTTMVMLKQQKIEPHPAAPLAMHTIGFTVTVVTALTDTAASEDELDDSVVALCHALDEIGVAWEDATKVLFDDTHLAYDISVQITSSKEPR